LPTSCVVADRYRRRLSALFVDAVGHCLGRLASSSATAVAKKLILLTSLARFMVSLPVFLLLSWPTIV